MQAGQKNFNLSRWSRRLKPTRLWQSNVEWIKRRIETAQVYRTLPGNRVQSKVTVLILILEIE